VRWVVTCLRQAFTAVSILFGSARVQMQFVMQCRESRSEVLARKPANQKEEEDENGVSDSSTDYIGGQLDFGELRPTSL
jgi:hypothetical protein